MLSQGIAVVGFCFIKSIHTKNRFTHLLDRVDITQNMKRLTEYNTLVARSNSD